MNVDQNTVYKIVELKGALVILEANDNVQGAEMQPLMQGGIPYVVNYLAAYLTNRAEGKTQRLAHVEALEYIGATPTSPN